MDDQYPAHVIEALENIESLKLEGNHEESIKEAQKLLCEDPNCVPALEELADNYVSIDQFESAKKAAKHALKLEPKSYTSYYILGFIESNLQNWSKSIDHLKKANELHANNSEILRCLGWVNFNIGKKSLGIVILERALNLDPENSLTLCDLGICYLQVKKFNKSVELLKKAMEIDPENKRIQDCYKAAKGFSEQYSSVRINPKKRFSQKNSLN